MDVSDKIRVGPNSVSVFGDYSPDIKREMAKKIFKSITKTEPKMIAQGDHYIVTDGETTMPVYVDKNKVKVRTPETHFDKDYFLPMLLPLLSMAPQLIEAGKGIAGQFSKKKKEKSAPMLEIPEEEKVVEPSKSAITTSQLAGLVDLLGGLLNKPKDEITSLKDAIYDAEPEICDMLEKFKAKLK